MDHRCRLLAQQGKAVQREPGLTGLLRHPLHRHGTGVRAGAALPQAARGVGRGAGGATDSQALHLLPVHLALVHLHPAGVAGGILPRAQLLKPRPLMVFTECVFSPVLSTFHKCL